MYNFLNLSLSQFITDIIIKVIIIIIRLKINAIKGSKPQIKEIPILVGFTKYFKNLTWETIDPP